MVESVHCGGRLKTEEQQMLAIFCRRQPANEPETKGQDHLESTDLAKGAAGASASAQCSSLHSGEEQMAADVVLPPSSLLFEDHTGDGNPPILCG